ncbi:MAG: type II toxin-antitoxin system HicA family toxin [Deltaproteobacteria bacterium]|nr:MAG: type II toxin-antitoxin system HicA family toxin [Deltaproteobacteria bacterium]
MDNDIKKCYHKGDKRDKAIPLNKKYSRIVRKIFARPERADIKWNEVESLILNLGGIIKEGSGSRKRFCLNNTRSTFHEPHPGKELDKGAVKSLRKYLINSGVFNETGSRKL